MFEFLNLKSEAFGLDISDLSLKIIKLKKKRGGLGLTSFGESQIKPGIIKEGENKYEKSLVWIIREAMAKIKGEKLKTKYVIASLPEEKAYLQVIQMPIMKEEELMSAVIFEAENYIPLPIEDVYLGFQVVLPIYNHLDHTDVLIAALPKNTVDPYVSCLAKAGLIPQFLEIESLAISRALIKNEASNSPVLLVDFGATRTSLIMFSGHSLRFTSSIPISSQKFTEAISQTLKVSFKKAEELKLEQGLLKDNPPAGGKEGEKVFEALIPAFTDLTEQIKKHLSFYQTHSSHEHLPPGSKGVEKILLCGGGANLKGLCDFLSLELKTPVEVGNPWINILPKPLKEVPELPYKESLKYATALGLALRGVKKND